MSWESNGFSDIDLMRSAISSSDLRYKQMTYFPLHRNFNETHSRSGRTVQELLLHHIKALFLCQQPVALVTNKTCRFSLNIKPNKDKILPMHAITTQNAVNSQLHSFLTSAIKACDQLHAMCALSQGKQPPLPTEQKAVWVPEAVCVLWKRNISWLRWQWNSKSPVMQPAGQSLYTYKSSCSYLLSNNILTRIFCCLSEFYGNK
jgi:hypothetical protein